MAHAFLKNDKGSTLLSTLIILLVLTISVIAAVRITTYDALLVKTYGEQVQARWNAWAGKTWAYNQLTEGRQFSDRVVAVGTPAEFTLQRLRGRQRAMYKITGESAASRYPLFVKISGINLSDFAIARNDYTTFTADNAPLNLSGPIYIGQNAGFVLNRGAIEINSESAPALIYGGSINYVFQSQSESEFVSLLCGSAGTLKITALSAPVYENAAEYRSEIIANHYYNLPSLSELFQKAATIAGTPNNINSGTIKRIVNQALLEKIKIANGTGNTTVARIPEEFQGFVENVYCLSPAQNGKAHPIKDRIGFNPSWYDIRGNEIQFPSISQAVKLPLADADLNELNCIPYSTRDWSVCSRAQNILTVYYNNRQLTKMLDWDIDTSKQLLYFPNAPFTKRLGRGDSATTRFSLPLDSGDAPIIFVGRSRCRQLRIENKTVVFQTPPPNGVDISYYAEIPSIAIRPSLPPLQSEIAVDAVVAAEVVDLSSVYIPKEGILISDRPLYLVGAPSRPVTVIASDDAYIGRMNHSPSAKPVCVIAKRIWLDEDSMPQYVVYNCCLYTTADRLYPYSARSITPNGNWTIYGSLTMLCRERPAGYADNVAARDVYCETPWDAGTIIYRQPFKSIRPPFTPGVIAIDDYNHVLENIR